MMRLSFLLFLLLFISQATGLEADCNGDGEVSSADALLALKMAVGTEAPRPNCDVNADQRVTSFDAIEILTRVVGEDPCAALVEKVRSSALGIDVSGFAAWLVGDQRVNVRVKDCVVGVVVAGGRVKELEAGGLRDATIEAEVGKETLERLQKSENPIQEIKEALERGEIKVKAKGFINSLKLGLAKVALKFF